MSSNNCLDRPFYDPTRHDVATSPPEKWEFQTAFGRDHSQNGNPQSLTQTPTGSNELVDLGQARDAYTTATAGGALQPTSHTSPQSAPANGISYATVESYADWRRSRALTRTHTARARVCELATTLLLKIFFDESCSRVMNIGSGATKTFLRTKLKEVKDEIDRFGKFGKVLDSYTGEPPESDGVPVLVSPLDERCGPGELILLRESMECVQKRKAWRRIAHGVLVPRESQEAADWGESDSE